MPQFDKDKTIPLLAVIVAGAALGAVGRHIALQQSGDTGTANITFGIVFGGCLLIYFLFITLCEVVSSLIMRKKKSANSHIDNAGPDSDDLNEEEKELPVIVPPTPPMPDILATSPRADWGTQRERELSDKLLIFKEYTHFVMVSYVSESELARLDEYVELFAREAALPQDFTPIKPERLKNPDLYHFGWNMQNYFKVGKREDVVPWLQRVFAPLRDLEFSTIKGKLHDGYTQRHTIPNVADIPKFMASKRG